MCGGAAATAWPLRAQRRKPNVLFFAIDDLRPELGCYGRKHIRSPRLDQLAAEGLLFENAYCQQAVCSPSRSSLMTGRRPDTTGVYDLYTHFRKAIPDVLTLPQYFAHHGYKTTGLGKIYHGATGELNDAASWTIPAWRPGDTPWGGAEAAERAERLTAQIRSSGWVSAANAARYGPKSDEERLQQRIADRRRRGPSWQAPDVPDNAMHDGQVADQAIECLNEFKDRDEPFFLAVGFIRPHLPFTAPKKYFDLYPPKSIELADNPEAPVNAPRIALHTSGELRGYADIPMEGDVSAEKARELIRGYYASTSYMDAQIGRVLDEVRRLSLEQDTIVILWGDHGYHLGDHGLWNKHTNFEKAAHCPLLLKVPGRTNGERTEALTEFVDIYPSLVELAGLPPAAGVEGSSFAPLLDDPEREWKRAALSQYPRSYKGQAAMGRSLRTKRYRYTEWRLRDGGAIVGRELYDHRKDPDENVNIASKRGMAGTLLRLGRWMEEGWQGARPPAG